MATTKPPRKAPRYYEVGDEKKPAQDEQKKKIGVVVKPKTNQAQGKKKPQKKGGTTVKIQEGNKKKMGVVITPKANQAQGKKKPQKKGVTTGKIQGGDKKRMGVVIKPKANQAQGKKKPQKKGVTTGKIQEGDKKRMGVVIKPKANQALGKKKPQKKGVTTGKIQEGDKKRMGVVIKPKANQAQGKKKPQKKGVTTGRNHKEEDKKRMGVAVKWRTNQAQWKKKGVITGKMQRNNKEDYKKRVVVAVKWKTNQEWKKKNQQKKDVISGATDPFPGLPSVPKDQLSKYERARKVEQVLNAFPSVKKRLKLEESKVQSAVSQAARHDLLLPEEEGFLEGDEGEDTNTITQQDIAEVVDITSASKHFNLSLNQFGPYRINYSRNGRHLLLAGQRGHVASMDWHTKKLYCEMNVMETVNDVRWLHTHAMFAAAQKKWLYIYDNLGVELHCIKKFNDVLRMEFLPYHFLLATCSATGFLQYLDVSVGKEITATSVKAGRLNVMCQNPHNAVIHLGHHNGNVSLWSPSMKEPLVKMLCHGGAVRALSIDKTGMYMASSGTDRKLMIFDLRTYRHLTSCILPLGAGSLCHSQRGLLAAGVGNVVQVYKDTHLTAPRSPYMCLSVKAPIHGLQFCPYEDVLGIGHGGGFTSMIVPGAGEANFDGLECNPYETKKQRQEWEVKALLEKIQPELITLDPTQLGEVDVITMEKKRQEQVERMGFDPYEKTRFVPRHKLKGRSSTGNLLKRKKKVAHEDMRAEIRKSIQEREKAKKSDTTKVQPGQRSALDRFKK